MEKNKKIQFWQRYIDGLYTAEDVEELRKMERDSPADEWLDDVAKEVWEESALLPPDTDVERERHKEEAHRLLRRINRDRKTLFRRWAIALTGVAAMICLVWGGLKYWHVDSGQSVMWLVAATSYGEQKEVILPDSTRLILNACSQVRYPDRFVGESRKVELEGEGYFQVTHRDEQPFIVATQAFDVLVLGTCFNVKAYAPDEIVSVDVESGKVQVDLPEAMMRLKADEQILINRLSGEYRKQHHEQDVAVWRNGGLRFDATPIRDVAKVLERRYNCRITFAAGQEFDNFISGEHDNQSLEVVLQSIEFVSGIHYRVNGNQVLLYKNPQ